MSEGLTYPNLLEAARLAIAGAFEGKEDRDGVKLPLRPADRAINDLLTRLQWILRGMAWVDSVRSILDEFLTNGSYPGTVLSFEGTAPTSVRIYGAARAADMTKALGGRWRKKAEHGDEYFDYVGEDVPGLGRGMTVTISRAEPKPKKIVEEIEL
jgi:hypothetical protein